MRIEIGSTVSALLGVALMLAMPGPTWGQVVNDHDEATRGVSSITTDPIDFSREVRPLLSDRCFACHGPNEESREGNLRLDLRDSVFGDQTDSGMIPIVPGDADESELVRRILSDDEDERMPPAHGETSLATDERELIRRWVDQGAVWKEHWAYVVPVRPEIPETRHSDRCRTPIDHFILARLDAQKLSPSSEADRETLIRRVTFDLTGLPPTIEEVDAFLADVSTESYERVVDRLLRSPRYGEHMARYWLDAARYSDTHGLHFDNYREMWPYRDWVVRAFNNNKPFDQFAIEQLAGDLLENPTNDQIVATGFNRCHVSTSEGGSIEEEVLVRNVVDRVVTTNLVFMASTFDCTRCHDHKYDPFTMKDFYSEFAFFNSIDGGAFDGNVKDTYPITRVPTPEQSAELSENEARIGNVVAQKASRLLELDPSFARWVSRQKENLSKASEGAEPCSFSPPDDQLIGHFHFDQHRGGIYRNAMESGPAADAHGDLKIVEGRFGTGCRITDDAYLTLNGPFDLDSKEAFSLGAWVKCASNASGTVLAKASPDTGVARYRGYTLSIEDGAVAFYLTNDAARYESQVMTSQPVLRDDQWQHLFVTYDGSGKAAGISIYVDGARQRLTTKIDSLTTKGSVMNVESSGVLQVGRRGDDFPLIDACIDDIRIYKRLLDAREVVRVALAEEIEPLLALKESERTERQTCRLKSYYAVTIDQPYIKLLAQEEALLREQRELLQTMPTTLVFRERKRPRDAFVLTRGEYDKPAERVSRLTPAVLPPFPEDVPVNRLGFALWLMDPGHPLTARVQVNRLWQQIFGTGIVASSDDFGSQGTPPSHPELLDWLAVEFREGGWDIKAMMKMIVMSSVYRQSSALTPELLVRDPGNRLLARGTRFRLDAEMIRDQALAVGGLLLNRLGGPSVKPPQPDGIWYAVGLTGSNTVRFVADKGANKVHRRTLYTFIKRTAGPPQMTILDGPSRETCTIRRERTDTPIQALLLMNDPQFIEAAKALALRCRRECEDSPEAIIDHMYRLCTSRHADSARVREMLSLYRDMLVHFEEDEEAASALIESKEGAQADADLAAWTLVANLVLNLDEVLNKN